MLLAITPHISACEPENGQLDFKKQKRIEIYRNLFAKGATNSMPLFVDKFFKGAVIANRNNKKRCDVYWDPDKRMDLMGIEKCGIWGNNYLRLTPCGEKYNLSFNQPLEASIAQIVEVDTKATNQSGVKLTIYFKEDKEAFGKEVFTLEIAPIFDNEDTE